MFSDQRRETYEKMAMATSFREKVDIMAQSDIDSTTRDKLKALYKLQETGEPFSKWPAELKSLVHTDDWGKWSDLHQVSWLLAFEKAASDEERVALIKEFKERTSPYISEHSKPFNHEFAHGKNQGASDEDSEGNVADENDAAGKQTAEESTMPADFFARDLLKEIYDQVADRKKNSPKGNDSHIL